MDPNQLVEMELNRHDWSLIREADGPASNIPFALRELLSSNSPDDVRRAYWKLENHVVVQGQLFEVAVYVTSVLLAALVDQNRPTHIRRGILELLFQIVNGTTHEDEKIHGHLDLDSRCRASVKEGIWLLYLEYAVGESAAAREILLVIEDDRNRLALLDM